MDGLIETVGRQDLETLIGPSGVATWMKEAGTGIGHVGALLSESQRDRIRQITGQANQPQLLPLLSGLAASPDFAPDLISLDGLAVAVQAIAIEDLSWSAEGDLITKGASHIWFVCKDRANQRVGDLVLERVAQLLEPLNSIAPPLDSPATDLMAMLLRLLRVSEPALRQAADRLPNVVSALAALRSVLSAPAKADLLRVLLEVGSAEQAAVVIDELAAVPPAQFESLMLTQEPSLASMPESVRAAAGAALGRHASTPGGERSGEVLELMIRLADWIGWGTVEQAIRSCIDNNLYEPAGAAIGALHINTEGPAVDVLGVLEGYWVNYVGQGTPQMRFERRGALASAGVVLASDHEQQLADSLYGDIVSTIDQSQRELVLQSVESLANARLLRRPNLAVRLASWLPTRSWEPGMDRVAQWTIENLPVDADDAGQSVLAFLERLAAMGSPGILEIADLYTRMPFRAEWALIAVTRLLSAAGQAPSNQKTVLIEAALNVARRNRGSRAFKAVRQVIQECTTVPEMAEWAKDLLAHLG